MTQSIHLFVAARCLDRERETVGLLHSQGLKASPISRLQNSQAYLSVVLAEIGEEGLCEAASILHQHNRLYPLIAFGRSTTTATIFAAIKSGAFDYVCLPADGPLLRSRITDVVDIWQTVEARWQNVLEARESISMLTAREFEVLRHVVRGSLSKQIAFELGISQRTVEIHRSHVMMKLRAKTVIEALKIFVNSQQTVKDCFLLILSDRASFFTRGNDWLE